MPKQHKEIYVIVDANRYDAPANAPVIAFTTMRAAERALEYIKCHEASYPFPGREDQTEAWAKSAPYGEEHACENPTILILQLRDSATPDNE